MENSHGRAAELNDTQISETEFKILDNGTQENFVYPKKMAHILPILVNSCIKYTNLAEGVTKTLGIVIIT